MGRVEISSEVNYAALRKLAFWASKCGDYGVSLHVGSDDARKAVCVAEDFFEAVKNLLSS